MTPSRRRTLQWMLGASAAMSAGACGPFGRARWPHVDLAPITGPGYGGDPALTDPSAPWPLTLSDADRAKLRVLADIILPADETSPSAATLDVDAFVDEWVSAPYEPQQQDRALIVPGLAWLDAESQSRFGADFVALSAEQQRDIIDPIAFRDRAPPRFFKRARFFDRTRQLIMAAYYTTPEGWADVGYVGNVAMNGDWPGPSEEALAHLREKLEQLGLEWPA